MHAGPEDFGAVVGEKQKCGVQAAGWNCLDSPFPFVRSAAIHRFYSHCQHVALPTLEFGQADLKYRARILFAITFQSIPKMSENS